MIMETKPQNTINKPLRLVSIPTNLAVMDPKINSTVRGWVINKMNELEVFKNVEKINTKQLQAINNGIRYFSVTYSIA
jgi:hypothetical protein